MRKPVSLLELSVQDRLAVLLEEEEPDRLLGAEGAWAEDDTTVPETVYWPTLNMIVWGLLTFYFNERQSTAGGIAGGLLAAVMLWDVLLRGQLGFTYSFLEEIWSRNIANLMMSPLRPAELAGSLMVMSLIRLVLGMTPVTALALALFGFNVYSLGLPVFRTLAFSLFLAYRFGRLELYAGQRPARFGDLFSFTLIGRVQ